MWKTRRLILLTRAGGGALEAEETYFDQLMQNVSSLVRQDKDMDKAKRRRLVFLVLKHSHSLTHELKVTCFPGHICDQHEENLGEGLLRFALSMCLSCRTRLDTFCISSSKLFSSCWSQMCQVFFVKIFLEYTVWARLLCATSCQAIHFGDVTPWQTREF